MTKKGHIPWNKGKKMSEEQRKKLSQSGTWFKKGRPRTLSDEERRLRKNERQKKYHADPKNKERLHNERRAYLEKEERKIIVQFQKGTVWRKWYEKNKDKLKDKKKKYYQKNKDKLNAQRNITRNKNYDKTRDSLIRYLGGYVCSNIECKFNDPRALEIEHIHDTGHLDDKRFIDDRQRNAYYVKHHTEASEHLRVFCSNCNAIKEYERKKLLKKSDKPRNIKNREEYAIHKKLAFEILGGFICVHCGFKDHRALDLDHIHGKGALDRKSRKRHDGFFIEIIENPDESKKKFQILCRNCNEIKKNIAESENS